MFVLCRFLHQGTARCLFCGEQYRPPGSDRVYAESGAKTAFYRLCTGDRDDNSVLSAVFVICIHRLGKKYAVENFKTLYITRTHTEYYEIFTFAACIYNFNVLPSTLKSIRFSVCGKKKSFALLTVLRAFESVLPPSHFSNLAPAFVSTGR